MAFFLKHTNNTNTARLKTTENKLVFDTEEKSQEKQDEDDTLHVSGTNQSLIDYSVPDMHCSHMIKIDGKYIVFVQAFIL